MSDENQEVLEDAEELQEFKADHSDAEVAEPTGVKAKPLPGSKAIKPHKPKWVC
jgi:hypothetical protein